jgi:HSP20 family protein
MKTLETNPLQIIDRTLNNFLNLSPVFHSLDEIYRTGDQVRFSQTDDGLVVQVDLPGVPKKDLDISTDTSFRDVYIKARRQIKSHDGARTQEYNRSFSIGREFDLDKISFNYQDGVLEVSVPRRKKEEHIKKYTL